MHAVQFNRTPSAAIFASDDLFAARALREARLAELAIGDDVALIGYDGGLAHPLDLTTIRQPFPEGAQVAYATLQDLTRSARAPRTITLGVDLIPRRTG